ncbi:MAG: prolyl oligopeptidase family serine peptidase [Verrucomicrobiia bacterium]
MNLRQTCHSFERSIDGTVHVRYLLFLPQAYKPRARKRWPLILFLHGAGERGSDLLKVAAHGPPKIVEQQPDLPFIVVSPQCPSGQIWSNEVLLPLLEDVMESNQVDPGRVYLTGLSMGGYGVWNLALSFPERFAAAAAVCGGSEVLKILLAGPKALRSICSLGVWAFHGAKDPIVPLSESERVVAALRQAGNPAKLTVYPEAGHDSWTETYENPELYRWFLKHKRRR